MRKQSIILYALGFLTIAVMALVMALTVSVMGGQSVSGEVSVEKPRLDLPDDIPWDKIPWREFPENFPWDEVPWEDMPENTDWENVPWQSVPWEKLPDNIPADLPWEDIPWEELPEDFPYYKFDWQGFPWSDVQLNEIPWSEIPWENIPENFPWADVQLNEIPWSEIPWENIPENFPWAEVQLNEIPWSEIPWENVPEDFPWADVPWAELPEDFPWELVPWANLPPDFPWTEFKGGKCPHKYAGGTNGDGWIEVTPATCSSNGEERRVCLLCRAPEIRSVSATGVHNFQNEICSMCSRRHIVLKSGSATAQYGGEPFKEESCTVESGELVQGHSVKGEYTQTLYVGICHNVFTATIVDGRGEDVSDSYVIDYIYGVLELTRRELTVITGSAKKGYDGVALTCKEYTADGLADGDRIELVFGGGQTVRGESQNTATVKIFNRLGEDVTANYSIKIIFGTLTVE